MRTQENNLKRLIFRRIERLQKHTSYDLELNQTWEDLQYRLTVAFPVPHTFDGDFEHKIAYHERAREVRQLIDKLIGMSK